MSPLMAAQYDDVVKRWARPTLRISLFLMLGAIVNVAVAWVLALIPINARGLAAFRLPKIDESAPEGLENSGWLINQRTGLGITRMLAFPKQARFNFPFDTDVEGLYPTWSQWPEALDQLDFANLYGEEIVEAAGWPVLGLRSKWSFSLFQLSEMNQGWKHAIPLPPATEVRGTLTSSFVRALPLDPVWPGFAINTLFYAAILWLVFAAPFAIRRRRRIKRGLCRKCAYPIGANERCTECGTTVKVLNEA